MQLTPDGELMEAKQSKPEAHGLASGRLSFMSIGLSEESRDGTRFLGDCESVHIFNSSLERKVIDEKICPNELYTNAGSNFVRVGIGLESLKPAIRRIGIKTIANFQESNLTFSHTLNQDTPFPYRNHAYRRYEIRTVGANHDLDFCNAFERLLTAYRDKLFGGYT